VLVYAKFRWDISELVGSAGKSVGGGPMGSFMSGIAQSAMKELMEAITLGFGAYVLVIAAIVLAVTTLKSRPVSA
jgi:hypothetical protein